MKQVVASNRCFFTASALLLVASFSAQAQSELPVQLDPVVVSVERSRQSSFDVPAAISAVTREVIENGGMQVNLSEALSRVPGLTLLNRQNYAPDLQLSIRGCGARSTFGVRGVRLIVTLPLTRTTRNGESWPPHSRTRNLPSSYTPANRISVKRRKKIIIVFLNNATALQLVWSRQYTNSQPPHD